MWRVYLFAGLISCVVAAVVAFVTVQLTKPAEPSTETTSLEGEEWVELGDAKFVYYKTPFASPPLMTFPNGVDNDYRITDQKSDSFKLARVVLGPKAAPLKWKAEGRPAK